MADSGGKQNLAFAGEIPMKDMKNGETPLSETQIHLDESPDASGLRKRHGSFKSDTDEGDMVPKPKVFRPEDHNAGIRFLMAAQESLVKFYKEHKTLIWKVIGIALLVGFLVYFGFAMNHEFGSEESWRLLVCTILGLLLLAINLFGKYLKPFTSRVDEVLSSPDHAKTRRIFKWILYIVSTVATVTLIIVLVALDEPSNLRSLGGLFAFILICFLTSYSPAQIDWHPVFWGFSIQFYFAVLILKTSVGRDAFDWLGTRVTEFLAYSDEGAYFVFDGFARNAFSFAFNVMPVVTFFSVVIAVLYYFGVMQAIIKVIGRFLSFCLGTTPAESINAAGNIFVGMTESPLMIQPFVASMTRSELHAVMTGGFATIAGSVLGAYIGFGVPADHLLSASVMSASAALAISKLTYPEIDEPIIKDDDYDKIKKGSELNVIDAVCNAAILSGKIIASIIVNVIAFKSLLEFVNATLKWFGDRVGKDNFDFEYICSYLLYPVALFMGTETNDCRKVAGLVGIKTFTNEYIAYERLSVLLKNREAFNQYELADNGLNGWSRDGDDVFLIGANRTLEYGFLASRRSEVIATYALCGFSNFGSMGILLGALSTMAPHRRPTMSKIIFRAMIAGNIACFFTACIAGLFYEPED